MTVFDARTIGRGWLSVAIASGKDSARPALDRTIHIEAYPHGLRLVATDSYVLLHSWVPNAEHELDPEPLLDEAPYATAIAMDPHGRGRGFLAHALKLAAEADKADAEPVEVRLQLGVVDTVDDADRPTFAGMEARHVVLELPDQERLKLRTYEADYPSWRSVLDGFTAKRTDAIALNPDIVGRLAKLGKVQPSVSIGWIFGGKDRMARLEVLEADPRVNGVVMPVRWDFDRGAPRTDDDNEPEAGE